jgi:hypothetical protein
MFSASVCLFHLSLTQVYSCRRRPRGLQAPAPELYPHPLILRTLRLSASVTYHPNRCTAALEDPEAFTPLTLNHTPSLNP